MLFADESAVATAGVRRRTRRPLLGRGHKLLQELWVNALLHINPAGAQADLSLRSRGRIQIESPIVIRQILKEQIMDCDRPRVDKYITASSSDGATETVFKQVRDFI